MAKRADTESARDVFDKEQPREPVERFFAKYPRNWSRGVTSWYLINRIHVTSCQLAEYRRSCARGCNAGSVALGSARAKNRNKTCKFNCIASARFPNERRPHRRTRGTNHFSEILNYKVGDNCRFTQQFRISIAEFRNKVWWFQFAISNPAKIWLFNFYRFS